MATYIIIETTAGWIWGDSRDFAPDKEVETPEEACRLLDESIGQDEYAYHELDDGDFRDCYEVYRADVDGQDVMPVPQDYQDPATVQAVRDKCVRVARILSVPSAE